MHFCDLALMELLHDHHSVFRFDGSNPVTRRRDLVHGSKDRGRVLETIYDYNVIHHVVLNFQGFHFLLTFRSQVINHLPVVDRGPGKDARGRDVGSDKDAIHFGRMREFLDERRGSAAASL